MKIGITERGDAGLDLTWATKLKAHTVNGAILITKNINPKFIDTVMDIYESGFTQIIIHCTCTGWGGSSIEPNVPDYPTQLQNLQTLINKGFPKQQCVLRIDPIFPSDSGIQRVTNVLEYAWNMGLLPDMRVRISIMDEYKHVKERLKQAGLQPMYSDSFYAPKFMMDNVIKTLNKYDLQFECCAEPYLINKNQYVQTGCISKRDLRIMKLDYQPQTTNPQNRNGCKCLSCKTELLNNKCQCGHKCIYCFWH